MFNQQGELQVQEIWTDTVQGRGDKMKIGSIYYTLRTKKPLKDAKAAYDKTKEGALDRYAPSNAGI